MRKLIHLQMLRAVAAFAVVVDHALQPLATRNLVGPAITQLGWFSGWLGVCTFFVISGLIMIRTSESEFGQPGAAGRFAAHRIKRIVPLYWLATLVYFVLKPIKSPMGLAPIAKSLLFIPYAAVNATTMRPIVGQGWTLNYEMFFYAMFALCLLMRKRIGLTVLLGLFPILVIAGLAVRPLFPYTDPVKPLAFWTDPIILFFAYGVLIGLAEVKLSAQFEFKWPLFGALFLFSAAAGIFWVTGVRFPLQLGWQLAMGLFCICSVVLCTTVRQADAGRLGRLVAKAGDASFSTYLFHPLAIAGLAALDAHLPGPLQSPLLFVLVSVVVANLVGFAIYYAVERPIARTLKGLFAPAKSKTVIVEAA